MQHIKSHLNRTGTEHIFLQIADIGCFLSEMRWHIMGAYVRGACIMERVRHCTSVVQKRQIDTLVEQEYPNSKDFLHRVIVIS